LDAGADWPLEHEALPPDQLGYLQFGGPIRRSAALRVLLEKLQPQPGALASNIIRTVREHIYGYFDYARDTTHVSSPIDDILSHGKGVCQDFAHLMIAVLRSFGMPARYVSGYIHRPNKDSQSHAWCEAWLPDLGWIGVDPTNNCLTGDHFVRVAVGRDFTDVTPNKGVYRGKGDETMLVRVETRELERVPSLSWRDELPPLDVPLTAIQSQRRQSAGTATDSEQQQQQ
jgi:transglutaminase-like putative cysteine protease